MKTEKNYIEVKTVLNILDHIEAKYGVERPNMDHDSLVYSYGYASAIDCVRVVIQNVPWKTLENR